MNIHVLYHGNCLDGFGSAFAAWKFYGQDATYRAFTYGDISHLAGVDRLYLLDVVPDEAEQILAMADQVGELIIIDHHKTAQDTLKKLDRYIKNVAVHFDMTQSAAVLTWQHFHGSEVPWLLKSIQDNDLWRHELPDTKEIAAALRSYPFDFEFWDRLAEDPKFGMIELFDAGQHVIRTEQMYYRRAMKEVQWMVIGGYEVPVINTIVDGSNASNELMRREKVHMAGYYYDRAKNRVFGLRSDGLIDASEVAKQYGGGGHPKAAGFSTTLGWSGD